MKKLLLERVGSNTLLKQTSCEEKMKQEETVSLEDKINKYGDALTKKYFAFLKPLFFPLLACSIGLFGFLLSFLRFWRNPYAFSTIRTLAIPLVIAFFVCLFWSKLCRKWLTFLHLLSLLSFAGGIHGLNLYSKIGTVRIFFFLVIAGSAFLASLTLFNKPSSQPPQP
jgi:hypothetical protein